jgi:hypothetical protein
MPTLPERVASWVTTPPDTSGYQVIPVPQFADGIVTGSITAGSQTLTVNTVPAGMAVNQWIVIAGTTCNFAAAGWCKITNISGNTLTLNQPATATVASAAVSWGLLTIQQLLYDKTYGYGAVFEFKQGYRAKWWPTGWHLGRDGLRIPGLPVDDNPSCSTHPCSINDPAHRWIVLRTAASPGKLPSPGVRTGPEYASVLGGVELQGGSDYSAIAAFVLSGQGENSMPAHHVRVENLASVPEATNPTAADPYPISGIVSLDIGEYMPQYVAVDRVYMTPPTFHTRSTGLGIAGKHIAVTNSYIRAEYWRPYVAHFGPDRNTNQDATSSGATITLPGYQWQRRRDEPLVTQGAASIISSGTASAKASVWVVMDATVGNGAEVRYSSGKGITVTCAACRAVTALADPTPTVTQKAVVYAEVGQGASAYTYARSINDSQWMTEGPDGIFGADGDHWLVENNHVEGYNKGFFVDVPTLKIIRPPEHVTLRRNHFYWSDAYMVTHPSSNGFFYAVRHVGIEFKRGMRILIDGNEFEGGFAGINHGTAITISETSYDTPVTGRVEDLTVRYNLFHRISESFAVNPHYVGTMAQMGADVARVYFGHNLSYDQNAWERHTFPGPYFYGKEQAAGGHDLIVEHNTVYDTYGNLPIIGGGGEDHTEGMWMTDNIFYMNVAERGLFGFQRENTGLAPIPDVIPGNEAAGATFDVGYGSVAFRANGATVTPSYKLSNNLFICGSLQMGGGSGDAHKLLSDTSFTSTQCDSYRARFGTLAAQNYFITAPATKAGRTAAVGWADAPAHDFRLLSTSNYALATKSTDGKPLGVDVFELDRQRGVISNLHAINTQAAGVGGCAGAGGTYCATVIAVVPDKGAACRATYGPRGSGETSWTVSSADVSTSDSRAFAVQGLAAATYDYRVRCAGAPPSASMTFAVP